jgi:hypothetical protein
MFTATLRTWMQKGNGRVPNTLSSRKTLHHFHVHALRPAPCNTFRAHGARAPLFS